MKYMLLICVDPERTDKPADVEPWVEEMDARGVRVVGNQLRPPSDATTVRVRNGEVLTADGPFAETKEWIAGFDIIECENLDEAIAVAAAHPMATAHMVEIRPFWS
ncbi:MAG TPA: YciI family protein [Streptosporangiaceae bacterium]|nr:YciI family protein [Streptosporangiaceae bacterium]